MSATNMFDSELLPSPLCYRYLAVVLIDVPVKVAHAGRLHDLLLRWGVGSLSDEQWEVLGAWHEPDSPSTLWQCICDDLKDRGVEHIRLVVGSDLIDMSVLMKASFPGVTVLAQPALVASGGLGDPEPSHAVTPRNRRQMCALDAAIRLNRSLERAIARHGCFPTSDAATTFVADWLARAERKRDRAELAMAVASHRRFIRTRVSSATASGVRLAGRGAP